MRYTYLRNYSEVTIMKTKKLAILCVIMAAVLLLPVMTGCKNNAKVQSKVTIKFQAPKGEPSADAENVEYEELLADEITVEGTKSNPPTVLQAAEQVLKKYEKDYELSKDGTYIATVFDRTEKDKTDSEMGYYDFWEATVNGEKSRDGRQSNTPIYDGDAIVYTYTSGQRPRWDTDAVVTTDPNEDTTVPADDTTAPETDEID